MLYCMSELNAWLLTIIVLLLSISGFLQTIDIGRMKKRIKVLEEKEN